MLRIDTHHHMIPPDYRKALQKAGIADAGGRSAARMEPRRVTRRRWPSSASAPPSCRFPHRAPPFCLKRPTRPRSRVTSTTTPPMASPHNPTGSAFSPPCRCRTSTTRQRKRYGHWMICRPTAWCCWPTTPACIWARRARTRCSPPSTNASAVVFIHPAELPGPAVPGVLPFAVDFLLDTTRAAYLLVRNGIRQRFPNIKFILSHAGGFVPYASHRMMLGDHE